MQSDILIFGGVIVGILVGFLMAYFMQGAKISAISSTLDERTSELYFATGSGTFGAKG